MPTDNILRSRTVVTAKVEGTYGTDPTPAATDAVQVFGLQQSFPTEVNDRKGLKNTFGPLAPIHGRKYGVLTFQCELKGSGTAGTEADIGLLLRACGTALTTVAVTSNTFNPISTALPSITIWVYRDGKIYEYNGCRGNAKLIFQVGKPTMVEFTFWGKVVDPIAGAIVSPTVDSTKPVALVSGSFAIGGYAAVISALELDFGNELIITDDVNDASGYGEVIIADRDPRGSFDPQDVLIATHNFWSNWESGTSQALTIVCTGSAGNIVTVTAPAVVYRELNESDRNGLMTWDIPFSLVETTGDNAFRIAFT